MRGIEIRDAGEADLAGLNQLEVRSFATDRLSRRSMRRLVASPSASLRVASAADAVLGYHLVLFRRGTSIARLYSIAVAKTARGTGLGRALMADAERLARRRGCRALRLEVRPDNRPAIRLYQHLGYRRVGIYRRYYADGSNALRFEKALARRDESRPGDYDEDRSRCGHDGCHPSMTARLAAIAPAAGVTAAEV
jgi:ribosomal protein S18 acetylase RimI-like enzyme